MLVCSHDALLQAAFECMYTLLETCLDRIDIFEFLNHVEDGLKDHYDVKMLTYLMLVRLSQLSPGPVLQRKSAITNQAALNMPNESGCSSVIPTQSTASI